MTSSCLATIPAKKMLTATQNATPSPLFNVDCAITLGIHEKSQEFFFPKTSKGRKDGVGGGGGAGGTYVWHQVSQKFKTEIGPGLKQKLLSV